jgi:hypothetical protein
MQDTELDSYCTRLPGHHTGTREIFTPTDKVMQLLCYKRTKMWEFILEEGKNIDLYIFQVDKVRQHIKSIIRQN